MSAHEVIRKALEEIINKILLSAQRRMEHMKEPEHRLGEYASLHLWSTKQLRETSVWLATVVVEGKDTILVKINGMTAMERLQMYQRELERREAKEAVERSEAEEASERSSEDEEGVADGADAADIEKEAWLKATGRVDYYR